jgi:hypothetical protein
MLDIFDDAIGAPERVANAPQPIAQQVARWRNNEVFVVFAAMPSIWRPSTPCGAIRTSKASIKGCEQPESRQSSPIAVARKLLTILNAMLRDQKIYAVPSPT